VLGVFVVSCVAAGSPLAEGFVRENILFLSNRGAYAAAVLVVALALAHAAQEHVATLLINVPQVRRFLMGKTFVEGSWLYQNTAGQSAAELSVFSGVALADIQFDDNIEGLKMSITRLNAHGDWVRSNSEILVLRRDLKYVNYFRYQLGGSAREGFATGTYIHDAERGVTNQYQGLVLVELADNEWLSFRQWGDLVSEREITAFKVDRAKCHDPEDWKLSFLKHKAEELARDRRTAAE